MSSSEVAALWDHGHVKLTAFATPEEVRLLLACCEELAGFPPGEEPAGVSRQQGIVTQIKRPHRHRPAIFSLPYFRHVVDAAKRILAAPRISVTDEFIAKPPRTGPPVPLHQDRAHLPSERPSMVTFWLALDPADAANGCMRYVPRSHLGAPFGFRYDQPDPLRDQLDATAIDCPAVPGDTLVHLANTLHGSGHNRSARERRCYIIDASVHPADGRLWLS